MIKFDNWFIEGWGMNMAIGPTIFVGDVSKSSKVKAMISLGVQKELTPYVYWRLNGSYGQLSGAKDKYDSGADANLKFNNKCESMEVQFFPRPEIIDPVAIFARTLRDPPQVIEKTSSIFY